MGVQTPGQSDKSTQEVQSWATLLDRNVAAFLRIAGWFAPHELVSGSPAPDLAVVLDAGAIWNGSSLTEVASQTVTGFTTPASGLTRIDRVVIDATTGVASRVAGTPGSGSPTPQPPAIPAGKIPICTVTMTDADTTVKNEDITDERSLISSLVNASGMTTIASGSLSSGSTLGVTDIPATYSALVVTGTALSSDTATRAVLVQVDTDNGASYDTTAGNYEGVMLSGAGEVADTALASLSEAAAAAAAATQDVVVLMFNYQGGGGRMMYIAISRDTTSAVVQVTVGIYMGSTSAINAIRYLWNGSGSFDGSGTYALYGVK